MEKILNVPFSSIEKHIKNSPFTSLLGVTDDNDILTLDFNSVEHVLITGIAGIGKSSLLNTILCSLMLNTPYEDVKFILVDPRKTSFEAYKGTPYLSYISSELITSAEDVPSTLDFVLEMYHTLREKSAVSSFKSDEHILVVIDELSELMASKYKEEIKKKINEILDLPKEAKIHLVMTSQSVEEEYLPKEIIDRISTKISFKMSKGEESEKVLEGNGAEELTSKGDALVRLPRQEKLIKIRTPIIESEKIIQTCDGTKIVACDKAKESKKKSYKKLFSLLALIMGIAFTFAGALNVIILWAKFIPGLVYLGIGIPLLVVGIKFYKKYRHDSLPDVKNLFDKTIGKIEDKWIAVNEKNTFVSTVFSILMSFIQIVVPAAIVFVLSFINAWFVVAVFALESTVGTVLLLPAGFCFFLVFFCGIGGAGFWAAIGQFRVVQVNSETYTVSTNPGAKASGGIGVLISIFQFVFMVPISVVFFIISIFKNITSKEYRKKRFNLESFHILKFSLIFFAATLIVVLGLGFAILEAKIATPDVNIIDTMKLALYYASGCIIDIR